ETTLSFDDFNDSETKLHVDGKILTYDHINSSTCLLRFKKVKVKQFEEDKLISKIHKLDKLNDVFEQTNEIAKVGGWEADFVTGSLNWTRVTKNIHEVDQDFVPDLKTGINFYKKGWSRDLITKLFTSAVEKNESFDAELKILTAKGNEVWVRSFGKPEFRNGKCLRVYGAFQDITEKKKRESEFLMTRERFEKIFNYSAIGIILVNTSNKLLMVNPASLKIFGLENTPQEKVLNLTFHDVIHPEDLAAAAINRKKLLDGEINGYKMEVRCFKASGELIWCTINTSIVYSPGDIDDLIITQVEEITEKKELEKVALDNAHRFKKVFENSPNGMGVVNLSGDWLMVNKNLSQIIGYSKEELLNLNFKDITHKDDLHNDVTLLKELVLHTRESYNIEKRYIHKNGKIVYCSLNVSAIIDENGKTVSLIGQVVDMSESIKAQRALKASLNELQSILNATTQVSIIETDLNGIIRKFNKGAENLLGYKASEVTGLPAGIFHDNHEMENRSKELTAEYGHQVSGHDVFTKKASLGLYDDREWTYIRKDKSRFPVQLIVTATFNHIGKLNGYLGVATDITNLKAMEASLINSKLKAEAANKSKSEFLANMSHEIRTPLNGVIGFTDLLMKTELSSSQEKYMRTVYNSANSLLDLLNDILDFSKIEAGKLELNEEKTDLTELCEQTIDIIKHQAHKKGLEILLNIPSSGKRFIYADSVRLRQILTNLLGNAVKFTEKGEIELKIETIECLDEEVEVLYKFSIRDTGIGIAAHNIKKIFLAFDQEDGSTTRKYGGTGLGVTISNKLLELMGSRLEVQSDYGKGTTFSFRVKFKSEKLITSLNNNKRNVKNVLVVDDNENNRTILKEMLAVEQIKTTLFSNGIDAIEHLEENNNYDLAIIDYHMPYINGIELIKHIRKKLQIDHEELPVILLHSSGEDELINQGCSELDVQFSVVKPIQINKLNELISSISKSDPIAKKQKTLLPQIDLSSLSFNILVAEDNPVNKFLTNTIITKILPLANIIEANDGEEAVKLYKSTPVDLIFMDIQMPILSGFEATEEIRAYEKDGTNVPIIALTARTLKGERERCLEFGMNDYITKPVILATIREIIIKYLVMSNAE
ncbi:MAG: PAS domain S-box protein, partial [Leeuwenhoekiella sp.]